MLLRGTNVILRQAEADDVPRLLEILDEPSVAEWWQTADSARTRSELLPPPGEGTAFVIEVGGETAGWIAYYEDEEPDYRHAGMDLFLGTAHQGHGIGRDALRTVARHLFDVRGHHRLIIDPAAANARAIHVYESIGFRPVGVMRQYERAADGSWRDGLLMDMLKGELR